MYLKKNKMLKNTRKNRLEAAGVKDIRVKIFNINEKLTELNRGYTK